MKMTPDELEQWGASLSQKEYEDFLKGIYGLLTPEQRLKLSWLMDSSPDNEYFWLLNEMVQKDYPEHFIAECPKCQNFHPEDLECEFCPNCGYTLHPPDLCPLAMN